MGCFIQASMNVKKFWSKLKEIFSTQQIVIKDVKDSNISIKINGKEKNV